MFISDFFVLSLSLSTFLETWTTKNFTNFYTCKSGMSQFSWVELETGVIYVCVCALRVRVCVCTD